MGALIDTIIAKPFSFTTIANILPSATSASEDFTFKLDTSGDDIFLFIDTVSSTSGTYYVSFDKGDYVGGRAVAEATILDGRQYIIPIESGRVERKNGTGLVKIRTTGSNISLSNIKIGIVKMRPVINR